MEKSDPFQVFDVAVTYNFPKSDPEPTRDQVASTWADLVRDRRAAAAETVLRLFQAVESLRADIAAARKVVRETTDSEMHDVIVRHALEKVSDWWNWSGPRPEAPSNSIGTMLHEFERLSSELDTWKQSANDAAAAQAEALSRAERAEAERDAAREIGLANYDRKSKELTAAQARVKELEDKLRGWLMMIAGGRRASIGSIDNTYMPQLSRERVDADLAALSANQGHDT